MTLDDFQDLLDTFGASPSAWPQDKREQALLLLKTDDQAVLMHEEALMLDSVLAGDPAPVPSPNAMESLFEDVARHAQAEENRGTSQVFTEAPTLQFGRIDRLINFFTRPSAVLGASAAAGIVIGLWDSWLEPAQDTFLFAKFVYSALPL